MKAIERRKKIIEILRVSEEPISATALASELGVSRQIIVGDVAILRAAGEGITSTPRGYVLKKEETRIAHQIACRHTADQMVEELQICIDHGCAVLDVIVEHPVYGQITGELQLYSRYDIQQFAEKVAEADAHSLSELTDGIHLHTLACPSKAAFDRVCDELRKAGILYEQ